MPSGDRTPMVLTGLAVVFALLAWAFVLNLWGKPELRPEIPLVDKAFLDTTPLRQSYADLVRGKEDLSDFDCYACHEENQPPTLKYDENHKLIVPPEHANIVMEHGAHGRNDNCFNCHNEKNRTMLQPRDGRALGFGDSTQLCGSCHGPTYRDWESGAHGRTNGYWNTTLGPAVKLDCVNCHNPHSPSFPGRKPAPGPHPLHVAIPAAPAAEAPADH